MLVALRSDRGLAQKQVARDADIDNSTLSRLESGDRGVSREVLDRICDVLGLTRRERLDVLAAAGFLTDEAARVLADEDISRLARLLHDPHTPAADTKRLRQFLDLALAYADARGLDQR
jgi:transcriptional regulator with XRE-family HTH domain